MNNTVSRCKSSIVNPVLAFRTLAVLAFVFAGSTARANLIQWSGNGHWYEAIPASIAWTDAKAAAEAKGGYLATITSAAENTFVAGIVASSEYWHLLGGALQPDPGSAGFSRRARRNPPVTGNGLPGRHGVTATGRRENRITAEGEPLKTPSFFGRREVACHRMEPPGTMDHHRMPFPPVILPTQTDRFCSFQWHSDW